MPTTPDLPPLHTWLTSALPPDVDASIARLRRMPDVRRLAVMPDVHLGSEVCVGMVVATSRLLYPSAVGGDLGCGMAAQRFAASDCVVVERSAAARLLAGLYAMVPPHRHPHGGPPLPDELHAPALSSPSLRAAAERDGRAELGTLGGGNHFAELQRDDDGALWLMVHTGSRGMGQHVLRHHLRAARGAMPALPADGDDGRAYLGDLAWALAYADANRRAIVRAIGAVVADVLGLALDDATYVACHHNYIRCERHGGEALWVHRKGAISAADGEPGIVPGAMGQSSHHTLGRGHPDALCSSAHGAGRAMSRSEARRRASIRQLHEQLHGVWFDHRLASRLRDEAPVAYKDIGAVMRAQRPLTRVVRSLQPVLSYKGA